MRLPQPELADPFFSLQGRRVLVAVDGQKIRGRLISCRDSFVTLDQDKGPRISLNKYSITSISEDRPAVSRCSKVSRNFWK